MRGSLALLFALAAVAAPAAASNGASLSLVPQPQRIDAVSCARALSLGRGVAFAPDVDAGGRQIVEERWRGLGIPTRVTPSPLRVSTRIDARLDAAYRLRVDARGIAIAARDDEGAFDALATLAQLPQRAANGYELPCIAISDRPALRWRIVSDDVSRGPLPTMQYFEERIRTLASFKINGYSPYLEGVFVDAAHPIVAPDDGITPAQLHDLTAYARRFHVALIPEQQTFAHMHETLEWEQFAPLAELPHGYLLDPTNPATYAYLGPLLREELDATGPVPFVHLGVDEPLDLGRGKTAAAVASRGAAALVAEHVRAVEALLRPGDGRPIIWDDAVQRDPSILRSIPRSTVLVDFHYGVERSYRPDIDRIAAAGFEQMISPGANDWNEFYPLLDTAVKNVAGFVADGIAARVLGMFMTVWHDDGESLYEGTWYPLAFAAASAWQSAPVNRAAFEPAFAQAFFGADAAAFVADFAAIARVQATLASGDDRDSSDYLFWSDPFDAAIGARTTAASVATIRMNAEGIVAHLRTAPPPLHANAARVLELAARRYDALARRFEIGREMRDYYDDARAHADGKHDGIVYRGLNVAKYACWEMRNATLDLERRYRAAWEYESRPGALDRVLVRYAADAERSQRYADRLDRVQREDFLRGHRLPPFDDVITRR